MYHHFKFKVLFLISALTILILVFVSTARADYSIFIPIVVNPAKPQFTLNISNITDNRSDYTGNQVPTYKKFEITFLINNSVAQNLQIPYDQNLPVGLNPSDPQQSGISVDGLFLPPGESDWNQAYRQPGFYYQYFDDQIKPSWDGRDQEWYYPNGTFAWKVRFAPDKPGNWQYKLAAQDAGGNTVSSSSSFSVISSNNPGFIHVSKTDPRYFEFDNGQPFNVIGLNGAGALDDPILGNEPSFQKYHQNGVNLDRIWISGMYGTAWLEWLGGRNIYDGYLPRSGTEAFHDSVQNKDVLAMRIDYEPGGDTEWYDACRFQFWDDPEAVKPHTNYDLRIKYWGQQIGGPRNAGTPLYGLVGKISNDWIPNCYEPGTGAVVTNYGGNTSDWGYIEGTWNSGNNNFVPRIYLGMENVVQGKAYIESISLREDRGNGSFGPEILNDTSMQYELYFPEQSAYAMDKLVDLAEKYNIYLKLVLMDKNDMIYQKMNDDGSFVINGQDDNADGFYGLGRTINKTRWLQQAWWRYLQARWGYSTSIHSWEATNEGDPYLDKHYELTDELGKFMHCRVFGINVDEGDGKICSYKQPDSHLVTTSFWHSFPATQFWMNPDYPNVDYADVHAYISTSQVGVPATELEKMQWDAAYYHIGHSQTLGGWKIGKPIVRGEAGIDSVGQQTEQPGLALDSNGVWLHNYIWSTLDPGALMELYWWGDNIENQPGPDGQKGLFEVYGYFSNFIKNVPLNNGYFIDSQATLTDPNLRVVGQKDTLDNLAVLWVQNKKHTWKNVVDNVVGLGGLTGTITINGFKPNTNLNIEWDTFTNLGLPAIVNTSVTTDQNGTIILSLPTDLQITDVGIKIGNFSSYE